MTSAGADRTDLTYFSYPVRRTSRQIWLEWLSRESEYASAKYDDSRPDHDAFMKTQGVGPESWWRDQLLQYVHRAHVLGLDNENGRQQLAKALATATGMVESMIRVYGLPSEPGHPSGEIVKWERDA